MTVYTVLDQEHASPVSHPHHFTEAAFAFAGQPDTSADTTQWMLFASQHDDDAGPETWRYRGTHRSTRDLTWARFSAVLIAMSLAVILMTFGVAMLASLVPEEPVMMLPWCGCLVVSGALVASAINLLAKTLKD